MKYKSRIDVCNYITLGITIIVMALPNFVFNFSWLYLSFMAIFDIIVVGQTLTTSYTFCEDELIVRSGLFKFGIYFDRILKVSQVKNLMDGAYSTARNSIRIEFGDKNARKPFVVDISPIKENEFLEELQKRCPEITDIENKRK